MRKVQENTIFSCVLVGGIAILLVIVFGTVSDNKELCATKCGKHPVIACDISYQNRDIVICDINNQPVIKDLFP